MEKLENEIKDESRVIWQKYHELNTYRIGELLKNNLELFVKKESSIFSAQVYEYNEIITADSVQIKVKFLMGYVEEQENLNSILQNYYLLPKKEYIEYKNLIEISDLDNIYMYLEKIVTKLKEVTLENSNIKYSYIWLLGDLLLEKLNVLNKISLVDDECVKEKLTANLRREGILKGILLNEPYWFNGKQDGDKKDRKYITSPFTFNDKSVIILFTGHKDIIVDEQYLVGLLKRFNEMFKK
ncbi:MAG: hypothetical protein RR659_03330 [Bacilli bacterium]